MPKAGHKLNIVYLSSPITDTYGGGEKFIESLIDGLPEFEHTFVGSHNELRRVFEERKLQTFSGRGGLEPVTPLNLLLSPWSFVLGLIHFYKLRRTFAKADLFVLALSYAEMVFVAPWLHLFLKKPLVFCLRHHKFPKIDRTPLVFVLKFLWRKHSSTYISKAQFENFKKKDLTTDKSLVITNGIKTKPFQPKSLAKKSNKLRLGFIGRLHKEKGIDTLLQSLKYLKTQKGLEILIAGDGPAKEDLKILFENLGLKKEIKLSWVGFVDQPEKFYKQVDFLVFPSRGESFGKVLTEGWERGLPVITSNIPVFLEIKQYSNELEQKLVFELNEPESLANTIDYLGNHLHEYLSTNQQQHLHHVVVDNFSQENMIKQYKELFLNITKKQDYESHD